MLGKQYEGFPEERWLDIRRIDLLAPILRARIDACRAKGFDGVDPDNLNGFENDTGFPLTATDQLRFNTWLANEAHARELSIGLKNDGPQAGTLAPYFDWVIVEECIELRRVRALHPCGQADLRDRVPQADAPDVRRSAAPEDQRGVQDAGLEGAAKDVRRRAPLTAGAPASRETRQR